MPRLIDLLRACDLPPVDARHEALIVEEVTADSRRAGPGVIFVALPGTKANGRAFIPDALERGTRVICVEAGEPEPVPAGACFIHVQNPRLALAKLAAALYAPQPSHIAAVTGTDGKTSTAEFFRQLAFGRGHKAASIGTLGTLGEGMQEIAPTLHTTPDPVALHRTLRDLARGGYTHVCMEASSHGLHQHRLDGVQVRAVAFTNLTRDHLDYHGSEAEYFAAKARLFNELLPANATAVLNADEARFPELEAMAKVRGARVLTYGRAADLAIRRLTPTPQGQDAALSLFGEAYTFALPQVGGFQVYNMLAALGLMVALGEEPKPLAPLLPTLTGVPGRLQRVAMHASAAVYIDYAHTPAALANVLRTLRVHTQGRLIAVFGCGGDRDRGKRPQMGRAAAELADLVFVTDDNPRSEDPAAIRAEVMAGCESVAGKKNTCKAVADRRAAIYGAVSLLKAGDVLLVAGKGHEKTQLIGKESFPFDDAEVVREAIAQA